LILALALILISSSFGLCFVEAKNVKNLGFIPSTLIWYSKDPFFAGDKIRIYSAVFNNSEYDFTGIVEFYDKGTLIGKSEFSVANGGGIRDVWIDWTAIKGSHKISARITNGKISSAEGASEEIVLDTIQTEESERVAEEIPVPVVKKEEAVPKTEEALSGILEALPPQIASAATSVVQIINDFADEQKAKLEEKKEELKKEIAAIEAAEAKSSEAIKTEQKEAKTITVSGNTKEDTSSSNGINVEKSIKRFLSLPFLLPPLSWGIKYCFT
jgi:hypothetical protein